MIRVLALLAVALAVAAGCGSAENEPNLAQAAERTQAVGTALIAVQATELEEGKPLEIACEGAADYARTRLRLRCTQEGVTTIDILVVDRTTYLRGESFGLSGAGDKWVAFEDEESFSAVNELAPERLLALLRGASRDTERVGDEDVRGEPTVRYRLTVDCAEAELTCDGTAPVEVWIDGEGLVRRIWLEDSSMAGTIEFFDFGADVEVEAPPADEVRDESPFGTGSASSCTDDEAEPISADEALAALREHGFSAESDGCGHLANGGGQDSGGVLEREGLVSCLVHPNAEANAPTATRREGTDGGDAKLTLANLECAILADSPTGETKIDRLEAAFADLERAIRP